MHVRPTFRVHMRVVRRYLSHAKSFDEYLYIHRFCYRSSANWEYPRFFAKMASPGLQTIAKIVPTFHIVGLDRNVAFLPPGFPVLPREIKFHAATLGSNYALHHRQAIVLHRVAICIDDYLTTIYEQWHIWSRGNVRNRTNKRRELYVAMDAPVPFHGPRLPVSRQSRLLQGSGRLVVSRVSARGENLLGWL